MNSKHCSIFIAKRNCPLCNCSKNYRLFTLHYRLFDDSPLSEIIHVAACSQCGFVYYDTDSTEIDFDNFYAGHYLIHAYNSGITDYQSNEDYLKGISTLLLEAGVHKDSFIADMGCGQGQLLRFLSREGFCNVEGVELFADYVSKLTAEGFNIRSQSVLDPLFTNKQKDVLIYKHIFEHFYNVSGAFEAASKNLKPDGLLLIAVPDANNYNSFHPYSFLHYLTLEHINHFDLNHIEYISELFGFTLVNSKSTMLDIAEDYPFPILTCLLRKKQSKEKHLPIKNFSLAEKFLNWYQESKDLNTSEILNLKKKKGNIYVWGLSYRTSMYLAMSELNNIPVDAYVDIDKRKQEKSIKGKPVVSPDILEACTDKDTIVIGVGPSSSMMENHIKNRGFKGDIIRLN